MKMFLKVCSLMLTTVALQSFAGEKVNQSIELNDATHVSIENLRGQVSIKGWNKDSVKVVGEIDDKAEQFIFEQVGTDIKIKVVMPKHMNGRWQNGGSDLTINVPKKIRLAFTGVSTNVMIKDIEKSTDIKSVSGNVDVETLSEYVEIATVSGDITSEGLAGKVSLSTVSGDILDENSQGRIKFKAVSGNLKTRSKANEVFVNTVSGEIDLQLNEVDELVISTVSGDVDGDLSLNNDGLVKMSSVSGDIDLAFENEVHANFRLKSNAGGDLINQITNDKAKHAKYGPSSKLYFETGNGNASVKASTVSGRIKLSQK